MPLTRPSLPNRRRYVSSHIVDPSPLIALQIYKRKARFAKDEYERELAAWQRMLTPDDIRTENAFRAAQRKAGKSRRSNLKDPNAPKKPLSAYFMFLQWIRADPNRVIEVFGEETETTRQSVLAAAKWRTLSDAEKNVCPFSY